MHGKSKCLHYVLLNILLRCQCILVHSPVYIVASVEIVAILLSNPIQKCNILLAAGSLGAFEDRLVVVCLY